MPRTMSTFSSSYQRLAMPTPTSTLLWKSAVTSSIGLPSTEPPKSAMANLHRGDVARPGVLGVGAGHVVQHADLHGVVLGKRGRNAEQDASKRCRRGGLHVSHHFLPNVVLLPNPSTSPGGVVELPSKYWAHRSGGTNGILVVGDVVPGRQLDHELPGRFRLAAGLRDRPVRVAQRCAPAGCLRRYGAHAGRPRRRPAGRPEAMARPRRSCRLSASTSVEKEQRLHEDRFHGQEGHRLRRQPRHRQGDCVGLRSLRRRRLDLRP